MVPASLLRVLPVVAALVVASGIAPTPEPSTDFGPDLRVPFPGDMVGTTAIDLAVSRTEIGLAFSGQSFEAYRVAIATMSLAGGSIASEVVEAMTSPAQAVRVAPLPSRGFAVGWQTASGAIYVEIQAATGWRPLIGPLSADPASAFDLLATDAGIVVAWVESTPFNGTLFVGRFSLADGRHLGSSRVDDHLTARKFQPSLAYHGGMAHLAWRRGTPDESAVFFARGPVNGTWSSPLSVSLNLNRPWEFEPRVWMASNGTAVVTYEDRAAIRDFVGEVTTYVATLEPAANRFGALRDLGASVKADYFDSAAVALDSTGRLRVVWLDGDRSIETGRFRVMYAESDVGWSTFGTPAKLNSDASTLFRDSPRVQLGPEDRVIVAWVDGRNGVPRPYLAASQVPPPPIPQEWMNVLIATGLTLGGAGAGAGGYLLATRLGRARRGAG